MIIVELQKRTGNLGAVNNRQHLTHYIGNMQNITSPTTYEAEICNKKCYLSMSHKHITKVFFQVLCITGWSIYD